MSVAIPPEVLRSVFGVDSIEKLDSETRANLVKQVVEPLWRKGNLRYLLHDLQLKTTAAFEGHKSRLFYLNCPRRWGKSVYLFALANEICLKKSGARVLYLAPSGKDARQISTDTAMHLYRDCPEDLKPTYAYQHNEFTFKNGSVIRVRGVNAEHADSLRGGAADLVVLDEAGQMDNLTYVIQSVCFPMTLTTGGKILIGTTPPTTPGHDAAQFFNQLADVGAQVTFTFRDELPHLPRAAKIEALVIAGEKRERCEGILDGTLEPETTTAQREYFCRFVTDANRAVIPEWPAFRSQLLKEVQRPDYFDPYVGIDPGSKDNTGIVYGYHDFLQNRLVIEDEDLLRNPTTNQIAATMDHTEKELWGDRSIYKRVSDVDLRLIQDLRVDHDIDMVAARKGQGSVIAAVHQLRMLITSKRLIIHPRCKNLDRQLENAIWNKNAKDMERGGEGSLDGHYDLVAALWYLTRSIDWHHNPYPANWTHVGFPGGPAAGSWVSPKGKEKKTVGLMDSTPTAKRLIGHRKPKSRYRR